jgi:ABC-type Na+ efflux pump permease subunit
LLLMQPGDPSTTRPFAGATAVLSLGTLTPLGMTMATWLVEHERTKETFAWLRVLPVSDSHIVLSKFIAVLVFYVVGGAAWLLVLGGVGPVLSVPQFVTAWLVAFVFASVALLFQFVSSSRVGASAPALLVFLALLAGQPITQSPHAVATLVRWWHDPVAQIWMWLACLAIEAVVVWTTCRGFRSQDAQRVVA